ncbi:helix-turn-helix domain-containing protein [Paenibacillus sp. GCM10023252]|uniref:helix-turn-helix domain-containing protein n=1 Tax=Paenibacillus sp. GCM10023252 TaxID=3252649 RepID=UPI00361C4D7D
MLKLIIAEDEKMERETIEWLVHKHELPVKTRTAHNGEEALRLHAEDPADLLFTDIRMPFVDGIELSRLAKERSPDLQVIIYSAYGEFEYARSAMRLGITEYLLKPLEVPSFLTVMNHSIEKAIQSKLERKYQLRETLRELLYRRPALSSPGGPETSDARGERYRLALVQTKDPVFDREYECSERKIEELLEERGTYINVNERLSVIFLRDSVCLSTAIEPLGHSLQQLLTTEFNTASLIIFGRPSTIPSGIRDEFQRLEQVRELGFFAECSVVWMDGDTASGHDVASTGGYGDERRSEDIQAMLSEWYSDVDHGDYDNLEQRISAFFANRSVKPLYPSMFVKCLFAEIVRRLHEKQSLSSEAMMQAQQAVMRMEHATNIRLFVLNLIAELRSSSTSAAPSPNAGHVAVNEVLRAIQENYAEDLSLEQLAQSVYMSPSYLSYLFKKKTGQSLSKYLTSYRLEQAKELLQQTAMKVVDISARVGYSNAWYFSHLFKTQFGVTPAQYRERK